MTKEELEKEAKEYAKVLTNSYKDCLVDIDDKDVLEEAISEAYLAGAEPREKQIQIDAEQIRALQKQNGKLTDKVKELEAQIEGKENEFKYFSRSFKIKNSQTKAQIEKMKECANCPVWLLNQSESNCKDCKYKEALILLRR